MEGEKGEGRGEEEERGGVSGGYSEVVERHTPSYKRLQDRVTILCAEGALLDGYHS